MCLGFAARISEASRICRLLAGADDLQHGAVRRAEMLPALAVGMLNVADEVEAGRKHGVLRGVKIIDLESHHRAGREEAVKLVGRTIQLQDRAVGELGPD